MTTILTVAATEAEISTAAQAAARAIPPAWPLSSSVAVNPFLGQTGEPLWITAARLGRVGGVAVTMPRSWYAARIASGAISEDDLAAALDAAPAALRPAGVPALREAAQAPSRPVEALPTVAELAAAASGTDWPTLIAERMGAWAASHFDEGQALWAAPRGRGLYATWRAAALHDLTPEIAGLKGFARSVADAPEDAGSCLARAVARLGLPAAALETYFHQLLVTLGGWAQVARYRLWQAELAGSTDDAVTDLLAVRILWEEALHARHAGAIEAGWRDVVARHAAPLEATPDFVVDAILQEAAERAAQRAIAGSLAAPAAAPPALSRPALQAAFCIDVRSEVFRRALESLDPGIRTLGFAGFFGLATAHKGFASDVEERRLPVLLNPGVHSVSGTADMAATDRSMRFAARARRAWGRFRCAAVSSFAFVEATGPVYAGKLVGDSLGFGSTADADPAPRLDPALDLPTRVKAAETVLRAMSLTQGFARLVLVAGHGANVVNNPHASALHCGACGGYSGEVNARLLAALLNDPGVRTGLVTRGIEIPVDTLFVAGLHDTTTDEVTLYDADHVQAGHESDLKAARTWLASAARLARGERALRLPRAKDAPSVARRSRDWAETRPEWGLAGCRAFVAAPRSRTAGRNLGGRAFLHDYDWRSDQGFGVLELILTAPVVVASWISLQYYGSTVAPSLFGGGNKLLHNVTGGIGVVEGHGGLLRVGLPWQSVHDGEALAHEPLRLSVCIEAPREAITDILRRHPGVRALFDNRWLHLFALDEQGQMAWRYAGDLSWTSMEGVAADEPPALKVAV